MKTSMDRDRQAGAPRSFARRLAMALTALVCVAMALPAQAQPQPTQGEASAAGDPPGRAARLSDVSGQVWLYNPDTNEWAGVERNQPLTTGDRIATDNDGRAEITLGTTTLRLDVATEIEIVRLDDARYTVRLQSGSVAARLRNAQALTEFELNTDEGRFRALAVGRFRFDRSAQSSDVTVYNGQAIFENKDTALPVTAGQHAQFWLDASGVPQYATVQPARDAFAAWNDERDRGEQRVATTRYVSPEMTGAEDLDRYGQWEQTPDYGPIWVPTAVPAGWAPYSAGHWAWVRPWGWTWVDDARWGFAPFHYGRWVYHRDAWCWAPGTYVARPVYAPALVAWIGGPRVGVSVTLGGGAPVGWFPLAPHEVYVPSYRTSPRYVREVNFTHVTNVTTITTIVNNRNGEADRREFANRRFEHAVTFVPADVMTRRQPVGPAAARFRNDPQVQAFVTDGRLPPVLRAPPVATPPVVARLPEGRPPPRPPFAGGAPGNFAGRPDSARPDSGRPESARPDIARGGDGRLAPGAVGGRPATLPPTSPAVTAAPPVAVAPPVATGGTGGAPRIGPPGRLPGDIPGAPRVGQVGRDAATAAPALAPAPAPLPAVAGPPVRSQLGVVDQSARPTFRGGRDTPVTDPGASPRTIPPSPVQRNAPTAEATARPGFSPRDPRTPTDAAMPKAAAIPTLPNPNPGVPDAAGSHRSDRGGAPRGGDPTRAADNGRPIPVIRLPEATAVAPPAPPAVRAAPPRPVEGQHPPPSGEAKKTHPEVPPIEKQR
jgi:hypothetical protein